MGDGPGTVTHVRLIDSDDEMMHDTYYQNISRKRDKYQRAKDYDSSASDQDRQGVHTSEDDSVGDADTSDETVDYTEQCIVVSTDSPKGSQMRKSPRLFKPSPRSSYG